MKRYEQWYPHQGVTAPHQGLHAPTPEEAARILAPLDTSWTLIRLGPEGPDAVYVIKDESSRTYATFREASS